MRKITLAAAFITALFLLIGCASGPKASMLGNDELDMAIRELSDYLNQRIPAGSKVVFLNVKSGWPGFSEYILSGLIENAVNDEAFSVVDRQQLDLIRSELNFQWSGEVSDASAQKIGQMLGAQTIVSGSVTEVRNEYRIQVRAISVQTAAVQGLFSRNVDSKGEVVAALTKRVVPAGASPAPVLSTGSRAAAGTPATPATPAAPSAQAPAAPAAPGLIAYKIGDTGPQAGLFSTTRGTITEGGGINTAPWVCDQLE